MRRFYINCYVPGDAEFPANTYCTDSVEKAQECVRSLLTFGESGISRIEILDSNNTPILLTLSPWDLDTSRPDENLPPYA